MKGIIVVLVISALGIGLDIRSRFAAKTNYIAKLEADISKHESDAKASMQRELAIAKKSESLNHDLEAEKRRVSDAASRMEEIRSRDGAMSASLRAAQEENERLRSLVVENRKELEERLDVLAQSIRQSNAKPGNAPAPQQEPAAPPKQGAVQGVGRNGIFLITFSFNSGSGTFERSKEAASRDEAMWWAERECLVYRARIVKVTTVIEPK